MEHILEKSSVKRVSAAISRLGCSGEIAILSETARTANDAAAALGVEVGQIASSLIFTTPDRKVVLVVTSGRHRVDTDLVAQHIGCSHLERVDANFVKDFSGFSFGGVSPLGWINDPDFIFIDLALGDYRIVWAAAGHPHAVFPISFDELVKCTQGQPLRVGT